MAKIAEWGCQHPKQPEKKNLAGTKYQIIALTIQFRKVDTATTHYDNTYHNNNHIYIRLLLRGGAESLDLPPTHPG